MTPERIARETARHDDESDHGAKGGDAREGEMRQPEGRRRRDENAIWIVPRRWILRNDADTDEGDSDERGEKRVASASVCTPENASPSSHCSQQDKTKRDEVDRLEPSTGSEAERAYRLLPRIEALAVTALDRRE